MNEEQIKEIVKLMGARFVGTKQEHQAVDAVVTMLCKTLKMNQAPAPEKEEEKVEQV